MIATIHCQLYLIEFGGDDHDGHQNTCTAFITKFVDCGDLTVTAESRYFLLKICETSLKDILLDTTR